MQGGPHIPSVRGSFNVPKYLISSASKTLVDLYDWNAEHNPDHPLFHFYDDSLRKTIPWKDAVDATHRAAHFFQAATLQQPDDSQVVVAILANTDTITYFCSIVGLMRAGLTAFLISTRNSAEAVRHLLTVTGAQYLLTSREPAILALADDALQNGPLVKRSYMPEFSDIFMPREDGKLVFSGSQRDPDAPTIILHSSGSTSFPKPITWSARRLMEWARAPWYGDINLTGVTMACHVLPMFHAMGVIQVAVTASCGSVLAAFKPSSPATVPTPFNVFDEAKAIGSEMIFSVPALIEIWATDPAKVEHLKRLKGLIFGGGPLSKKVGDLLASHGVCLHACYGSTEVGLISKYFAADLKRDWECMVFSEQMKPELVPMGDGTYELVLVANDAWKPIIVNTKINGIDAFSTKDLFVPHESTPGLWRMHGRADDQIMLSTGEKTNPGPLEAIVSQDPHVQAAVMFGRGRLQNGILIEPKKTYQFDTCDAAALEAFKDMIWPTIERMNSFAPQHSRIFREMIIVSTTCKPFSYTAKGTARRQAVIREYEEEIDALYRSLDTASLEIVPPTIWDHASTAEFVRNVVTRVLRRHVEDDADIFRFGLQATWIRQQIIQALRTTVGDASESIPQNCVYQAPSMRRLTALILASLGTQVNGKITESVSRADVLQRMVSQYTESFVERRSPVEDPQTDKDVVMLTGSTGSLGAHILFHLLNDSSVGKVYALNRTSASMRQQRETFRRNGLDESYLDSPKLLFLTGDISLPAFGLDLIVFEELQSSVTHIVHNAWKVDFNQSLDAFEPLLVGVRNLVNFCLRSPHHHTPRLLFTSSMGIFRKLPAAVPALEDPIKDADICVGSGYSESKWIAEQILLSARDKIGVKSVICRLGQISGGFNGYWNEREWFPSIVKSAVDLKCIPHIESDPVVTWLPAYEMALVLAQLRNCEEPVLHIAHPKPVSWSTLVEPIAAEIGVQLVPYATWLSALEQARPTGDVSDFEKLRRNPALRLMDHFRTVELGDGREPLGGIQLDVSKALQQAPVLGFPPLTPEWAGKWVKAWRECGFLA
ncbi:hypothetical protein NM688_g950 [Phlebia brevispora]|uniref:Uncharacterized protein n=1 Tax=Phlebia brevispora TaxID=194682 RepID=A0ACC1TCN8_9APHY|nr:hypothetical protein NM688_g950 [Phlebia brevispora]